MTTSSIDDALRTKLLSYTAISTLLGDRFYPEAAEQGAQTPYGVYSIISTYPYHTVSDVTRAAQSRIQIDCYADTQATANELYHAVRRSGICNFRGDVGTIKINGVSIDSGLTTGDDNPSDGNQEHRYTATFDMLVHYWEAE